MPEHELSHRRRSGGGCGAGERAAEDDGGLFSLVICTYAVAQREETPTAIAAAAAGAAAIAVAIARDPSDDLTNIVPSLLLFVLAPASAGWGLRRQGRRTAAIGPPSSPS